MVTQPERGTSEATSGSLVHRPMSQLRLSLALSVLLLCSVLLCSLALAGRPLHLLPLLSAITRGMNTDSNSLLPLQRRWATPTSVFRSKTRSSSAAFISLNASSKHQPGTDLTNRCPWRGAVSQVVLWVCANPGLHDSLCYFRVCWPWLPWHCAIQFQH